MARRQFQVGADKQSGRSRPQVMTETEGRDSRPAPRSTPLVRFATQPGVGSSPEADADTINRATAGRPARAAQTLLQLQHQHGNRHVQRVVQAARQAGEVPVIQAKLTIGPAGDKYEQEADRVAKQVVRRINGAVSQPPIQSEAIQRQEDEAASTSSSKDKKGLHGVATLSKVLQANCISRTHQIISTVVGINSLIIQREVDFNTLTNGEKNDLEAANKSAVPRSQWIDGLKSLCEAEHITTIGLKNFVIDLEIPYQNFSSLKACLDVLKENSLYRFLNTQYPKEKQRFAGAINEISEWVALAETEEEFRQAWEEAGREPAVFADLLQNRAREREKKKKRASALATLREDGLTEEDLTKAGFLDEQAVDYETLEKTHDAIIQSKEQAHHFLATLDAKPEHRPALMRATEGAGHIKILKAVTHKGVAHLAEKIWEAESYTYPQWQRDSKKLNIWLFQAEDVENEWSQGTFTAGVTNSIIYHFIKHVQVEAGKWSGSGFPKPTTVKEYSNWAISVRDEGQEVDHHPNSYKYRSGRGEVQCDGRRGKLLTAYIRD